MTYEDSMRLPETGKNAGMADALSASSNGQVTPDRCVESVKLPAQLAARGFQT